MEMFHEVLLRCINSGLLKARQVFKIRTLTAFTLVFFFASVTSAESYKIRISKGGIPVEGVEIFGTHGFNSLPARFTNLIGEFEFEVGDLSGRPTIAFASPERGYRFSPAELTPSVQKCPGRICSIEAYNDGGPVTTVINWTIIDSLGNGVAGVPVMIRDAEYPCEKRTDAEGYVLFAVNKSRGLCSDSDADAENNYFVVAPSSPETMSCQFSTKLAMRGKVCPKGANVWGYHTATCSPAAVTPPNQFPIYNLKVVLDSTGSPVAGVSFTGNNGIARLSSLITNTQGTLPIYPWQITGSSAWTPYTVVPYVFAGQNYTFSPPSKVLKPDSCPNNTCVFTASRNGTEQSAVRVRVLNAQNAPRNGVEISLSASQTCPLIQPQLTDADGYAYFPAAARLDCPAGEGVLSFIPSDRGCSFSSPVSPPFSVCPRAGINDVAITAVCSDPGTQAFSISGTVYGTDGYPLSNVPVIDASASTVATTDGNGRYEVGAGENQDRRISVTRDSLQFDPEYISFAKVMSDFPNVDFVAVAPVRDPRMPPVEDRCEPSESVSISGVVMDSFGNRVPSAMILDNHQFIALTADDGTYSFPVAYSTDHWISAEYSDYIMDPAAVALPTLLCSESDVDFRIVDSPSVTLGGQVMAADNVPMPQVQIGVSYTLYENPEKQGETYTDQNGNYLISVPAGAQYTLRASMQGFSFVPALYADIADDNRPDGLDFRANEPLYPPTPTPAPTNTRTPTNTPTETLTPTVTVTPAPTKTPTVTRTPTMTPIPSNTPTETPTSTPTNTPTVTLTATFTTTPTVTQTPTETATPSVTPTFTNTGTATSTPTVTQTPTETRTPTNTPTSTVTETPTNTGTPTRTPTVTQTATPTATSTVTRTPTVTKTPTNTATSTNTATPTITRTPTKTGTPTKTETPTRTPTPSNTPTVTNTPTNTSTPWPVCSSNLVLNGINGRKLTPADEQKLFRYPITLTWKALSPGAPKPLIRKMQVTGSVTTVPELQENRWYIFSLNGGKKIQVTSRPLRVQKKKTYCSEDPDTVNFAVKLKTLKLSR